MRILITGQSGFVGRVLFKELQNRGYTVRGTNRTASHRHVMRDIVAVGDVGSSTDWSEALQETDVIIHLANRAHVLDESSRDPLSLFREINVEGSIQLAKQAAAIGVKRFIFVSSIKVNGERTDEYPFTPEDQPNPQNPYAVSKTEAEMALRRVAQVSSMEVVIIRPPLVIGSGAKGNFQRLTGLVRSGIPLPIGSINNRRSIVSLGNLVDFLIHCIANTQAANQTFLVSDGVDLSTPDLIRMVASSMKQSVRLFPFPVSLLKMVAKIVGQQGTANRLCGSLQLNMEKNRRLLNWTPPYSLQQGIRDAVKHETNPSQSGEKILHD